MPWALPIVCLSAAAATALLASVVVRRVALRTGFVDRPGGHKAHAGEVALGGGVAIFVAAVVPMGVALAAAHAFGRNPPQWVPALVHTHLGGVLAKTREALAILVGALALLVLGLIDDRRALSAGPKFLVHLLVALGLAVGGEVRVLSHLGPVISIPVTVLWIVTIINAFNFLDNMDGLAAGVAAIVTGLCSLLAVSAGQVFVPACCWLLAGALVGFLPFNFQPARLYMGDAGSTVIGYLVAVYAVLTTFYNPAQHARPIGVVAPLVVLAVPLYDTASVIWLRWREGRSLWVGDRRHFSHRLVRAGMSPRRAVAMIWLATVVTGLPALLLPSASWPAAATILVHTLGVVALVALMESVAGRGEAQR
ncbi:MAG: MraY family glycosyltransferase [Phycisphaerae bacterium]